MVYKKTWKYILKKDNSHYCTNFDCYVLKALKDFSDVTKGDFGGYVQGYRNLSQEGDCWIYDNALVINNTKVTENAKILDYAVVNDFAIVKGNTKVTGRADIYGNSIIDGNAIISDIIISENYTKENFLIKIKDWFIKKLGNIF